MEVEDDQNRRTQLESYLDLGRGQCHLRDARIGQLVDGAIQFYHRKHYELQAWVVMPNHVHALFKIGDTPLGTIIANLKVYTARAANKLLGRRGKFWADDYFDTFIRNSVHQQKACRYIETNPVKAFLVQDARQWPWTSARFRDENDVLQL